MNNKGQVFMFAFMLGLIIIILALSLAPSVKEFTGDAYNDMDCTNSSISNFDKAACVVTDLSLFQFVLGILFIGGIVIVARILL